MDPCCLEERRKSSKEASTSYKSNIIEKFDIVNSMYELIKNIKISNKELIEYNSEFKKSLKTLYLLGHKINLVIPNNEISIENYLSIIFDIYVYIDRILFDIDTNVCVCQDCSKLKILCDNYILEIKKIIKFILHYGSFIYNASKQ
jgi:hypothetical protein